VSVAVVVVSFTGVSLQRVAPGRGRLDDFG